MLTRTLSWLVAQSSPSLTPNQSRAILALFLMVAFCYNALPPDFFYDGRSTTGESGSITKQLFWIGLFFLALSTRLKGAPSFTGVLLPAMPLITLCVLMLMSTVWSLEPPITLRRAILQCIVICSVFLLVFALPRAEQIFVLIYRVASIVLVLNLFMLMRKNGFDETGLFRGIHSHKNVVGYIGAISVIVGYWIRRNVGGVSLGWNGVYLLAWGGVLILALSKTSIALALGAPLVAVGFWWISRWLKVRLWVPIFIIFAVLYAVFAVAFIGGVDVVRALVDWVSGIGFTGRDEIWYFLIARFLENPWLGHGFGGFWDIGAGSPNLLYGTGYVPMINQAHNGYLDVLLSLGVLGAFAYVAVLVGFFWALPNQRNDYDHVHLLCWCLLVFSLLHNLTETSILRGYAWVWVVQLIVLAVCYRLAIEGRKAT